jgi:transketolase C-terminal domain/subunit
LKKIAIPLVNRTNYSKARPILSELAKVVKCEIILSSSIILEKEFGIDVQILDVVRIKPLDIEYIIKYLHSSNFLVTIEEQAISAAFGAAIIEGLSDRQFQINVLRLGLKTAYVFENGTRDQLLDKNSLGVTDIVYKIKEFGETYRNEVK